MKFRTIIIFFVIAASIAGIGLWTANALQSSSKASPGIGDAPKKETKLLATTNPLLLPNEDTPDNYIPPQYDPFNNPYGKQTDYKEELPNTPPVNIGPVADFTVTAKRLGFPDKYSGTVGTPFLFNANVSDRETSTARLQVRWDFESDGVPDTFFSRTKTALHTYPKAGIYNVTLEVLDRGGNIMRTTKKMTIVNNTPPTPRFTFRPEGATTETVIVFDTDKSIDSQYLSPYLSYRFDWNGDGIWDTEYDRKRIWRHKFLEAGTHHVVMEAKDPEEAVATASADVSTIFNTPPIANFTIDTKQRPVRNGEIETVYSFDASASYDAESGTKNLLYRWDFNYTGEDDIIFDTAFSSARKYSGTFSFAGQKTIRLQVKDKDGAVSEAFQPLEVTE